jgi:flagellar motor switch protein FliG
MTRSESNLTGREKAAILLIALGPEKASDIYRHLKEDEIEQLTLQIANLRKVDGETKSQVMEEFYQICLAQNYIAEGGISYAKDILERAFGEQKALDLINKLTSELQVKPFEFVRKAEPAQVLNYIQNEHPQTIAMILAYLRPEQAAAILSALPQEKQFDVIKRIALMDSTSPEIIHEVEMVMERKMANMVTSDFASPGGIQSAVDILLSVDRGTEKHILETLESDDVELVEEIRKRMFVFEDIVALDNRSIQRFLLEVDNDSLALALKSTSEAVSKVIFANMSKRLQEIIKEDMEFMGPVRLRDVEEAQQRIVNVIRKLEDEGEIIVSRGRGDEVIV